MKSFKQSKSLKIDKMFIFDRVYQYNVYASCAYKSNPSKPLTTITNDHIH